MKLIQHGCIQIFFNLHGERGNAQAFKHVADLLDVNLNLERIDDVEAEIDFEKYDILLFNAGELKVIPTILKSLNSQQDGLKILKIKRHN